MEDQEPSCTLDRHAIGEPVDKKVVEDDRFDDLEIVINQRRTRRQFKSSRKTTRRLEENDFIGKNSSLRIDDLVKSYTRTGDAVADEYRLCATWQVSTAALLSLLEPVDAPRTIHGHQAALFKLRAEMIWPQDSTPHWPWLGGDERGAQSQMDRVSSYRSYGQSTSRAGEVLNRARLCYSNSGTLPKMPW